MKQGTPAMLDDPRTICCVRHGRRVPLLVIVSGDSREVVHGDGEIFTANSRTRIECYGEVGQGAYVPWIAIYFTGDADGEPRFRFSADGWTIEYAVPEVSS